MRRLPKAGRRFLLWRRDVKTRPIIAAEQSVPLVLCIPPLPPPPADLVAVVHCPCGAPIDECCVGDLCPDCTERELDELRADRMIERLEMG